MTIKSGNKSLIWFGILLALLAIALSGYFWSSRPFQKPAGPPEKLVIAGINSPDKGAIFVALAKAYFAHEGLDVTFQPYPSGKDALNAVLEGKADLGIAAEIPIMFAGLRGEKVTVVATIAASDKNTMLIARKDRGISSPGDLKGKKIGVPLGTSGQFFVDIFLTSHRIPRESVSVVNLKPEELVDALVKGDVDAISTWNPHDYRARKELGDKALAFYGEGIYRTTVDIVAAQTFVKEKPETVKRVLRALVSASNFMVQNPQESIQIMAEQTKMDKEAIGDSWNQYSFAVTLDQSLLTTLEDQARWAIKNKLTQATQVPNYLNFIYLDGLQAVRPDGVTIIH